MHGDASRRILIRTGAARRQRPTRRRQAMNDENRARARELDPEVWRLFDQYVHGAIDRRGFLAGAARFAAGAGGAAALLAAFRPRFAEAPQVAARAARLATRHAAVESPQGCAKARG